MLFTSYFQRDVMTKRPYIQVSWLEKALSAPFDEKFKAMAVYGTGFGSLI